MSESNEGKEKAGEYKPLPYKLPAPTSWPATMALGVTAITFGIVTSPIMSVFGLILFSASAWGWFEDLRNDQLQ
jgi:hypothetical protein